MYKANEIKTVHMEVTSKCNARCPMCMHTVCGGETNPNLPLTELNLEDVKKILPVPFIEQLDRLYLCGNYGDPIAASETLEIFRYIRGVQPKIKLNMFTNGGARSTKWWSELAQIIDGCRFAIDGLEDTNHLYRQGVSWDTVMRNAQAFIEAGGVAEWDFIVFRHNEHQIESAKALSKKMGFKKIQIKKTGRFFSNSQSQVVLHQDVFNQQGELSHILEMTEKEEYKNRALLQEQELVQKYGSLEQYLNQTPVKCKVAEEKSVYISADGFVFPCCWVGNQLYPWYFKKNEGPVWRLIQQLPDGEKSINGKIHGAASIVESDFFQKDIPSCWSKNTIKNGKLKVCAKTCGTEFDPFKSQFT